MYNTVCEIATMFEVSELNLLPSFDGTVTPLFIGKLPDKNYKTMNTE